MLDVELQVIKIDYCINEERTNRNYLIKKLELMESSCYKLLFVEITSGRRMSKPEPEIYLDKQVLQLKLIPFVGMDVRASGSNVIQVKSCLLGVLWSN